MWIRRVRTKSGATAVQLAESVGGRRRIVRHVGSAHDEVTLGLLMEEARRLLAGDAPLEAARFANAAAALSTTGVGAVAPMPTEAAVRDFLRAS